MSKEIKPLKDPKGRPPPLWTMFLDATDPPAFSYSRIIGFAVIALFLTLVGYLSISSGALVLPTKEWVYILVSFSLMKPIQRFAETKDNEAQLNFDFQMAQLKMEPLAGQQPPPVVVPQQPPPYQPPPYQPPQPLPPSMYPHPQPADPSLGIQIP
jgi:hypothetical protein